MIQSNLVIRNFLVIAQLFTKANLFTIYQVNCHIGQRIWFTITKLFLTLPFLEPKFDCTMIWCILHTIYPQLVFSKMQFQRVFCPFLQRSLVYSTTLLTLIPHADYLPLHPLGSPTPRPSWVPLTKKSKSFYARHSPSYCHNCFQPSGE